jgi:hypothetical protein
MSTNSVRRFAFLNRFGPPTLLMLGSLWVLQSVFAHAGSHGVIIRNLNYDAGTVKAGSMVMDEVQLINLSPSSVEVDAQPGCGCTMAEVPAKPLASLHREVIKIQVDTESSARGMDQKYVLLNIQQGSRTWNRIASIKFDLQP